MRPLDTPSIEPLIEPPIEPFIEPLIEPPIELLIELPLKLPCVRCCVLWWLRVPQIGGMGERVGRWPMELVRYMTFMGVS